MTETPAVMPDMVMPQVSLKLMDVPQPDGAVKQVMMMVVETAVTHYEFLICTPETYKATARTMLDSILKFGAQFKDQSSLVVVKGGLPDGLKNGHPRAPQGRQHRR